MAAVSILILCFCFTTILNVAEGQTKEEKEEKLYLPPDGAPKPPSTNYNFLNLPQLPPFSPRHSRPNFQKITCNPPQFEELVSRSTWRPDKIDLLYYPLVYSEHDPVTQSGYLDDTAQPQPGSFSCAGAQSLGQKRKKQCIASTLTVGESLHSRFHYYDGCEKHVLDETCGFLDRTKLAIACELPDGGGELRQYGVLSDNHTYVLMYECWPYRAKKQVTWSLRSTSKVIPQSLKQHVLDYVQRVLGFDYNDYRQPDYSHCPDF